MALAILTFPFYAETAITELGFSSWHPIKFVSRGALSQSFEVLIFVKLLILWEECFRSVLSHSFCYIETYHSLQKEWLFAGIYAGQDDLLQTQAKIHEPNLPHPLFSSASVLNYIRIFHPWTHQNVWWMRCTFSWFLSRCLWKVGHQDLLNELLSLYVPTNVHCPSVSVIELPILRHIRQCWWMRCHLWCAPMGVISWSSILGWL